MDQQRRDVGGADSGLGRRPNAQDHSDMEQPKPQPPRISDLPAPVQAGEPGRPLPIEEPHATGGPPVHPLAAVLLLLVDNLWNLADWTIIDWIVSIPLSFVMVFLPALVIQRRLMKNRWRRAFGFAALLGLIAAVPTSVTGTPIGLAILAWTGISKLLGRPLAK
jgi:hypothetical protein